MSTINRGCPEIMSQVSYTLNCFGFWKTDFISNNLFSFLINCFEFGKPFFGCWQTVLVLDNLFYLLTNCLGSWQSFFVYCETISGCWQPFWMANCLCSWQIFFGYWQTVFVVDNLFWLLTNCFGNISSSDSLSCCFTKLRNKSCCPNEFAVW